jgi:hypothetical protein
MSSEAIVEQVEGVYTVLRLFRLRETPGVSFDVLSHRLVPRVDAVDRVVHQEGALSPGSAGGVKRPWYMHPAQDDHLMVLAGVRYVDLYSPILGRVVSFEVEPDRIVRAAPSPRSGAWENVNRHAVSSSDVVCDTACLLAWDRGVFHRIRSDAETGSRSVNLATHYPGFDIDTNFNIYDLDVATGEFRVLRKGAEDQRDLPG